MPRATPSLPSTPLPWKVASGGWSTGGGEGGWIEATDPTRGTFFTDEKGEKHFSPTTGVHICWFGTRGDGKIQREAASKNAAYIVHAANAYPKLVELVKEYADEYGHGRFGALLEELGEQ